MRTNKNGPFFHNMDMTEQTPTPTPHPAPPPLGQEVPQLNYALAGAVNKLSGRPEHRGVQVPKDSLS